MMELSGQRLIVKHDEGGGILASSPGQFCLYVHCTVYTPLKKIELGKNWTLLENYISVEDLGES